MSGTCQCPSEANFGFSGRLSALSAFAAASSSASARRAASRSCSCASPSASQTASTVLRAKLTRSATVLSRDRASVRRSPSTSSSDARLSTTSGSAERRTIALSSEAVEASVPHRISICVREGLTDYVPTSKGNFPPSATVRPRLPSRYDSSNMLPFAPPAALRRAFRAVLRVCPDLTVPVRVDAGATVYRVNWVVATLPPASVCTSTLASASSPPFGNKRP